ncbi:S41 family peptidase [Pueribacillus theae]
MKWQIVAALVIFSLFIGAGGTYLGMTLLDSNEATVDQGAAKNSKNQALTSKELDKIKKSYEFISGNYVENIDNEEVLEGAIKGMIGTLNDPYSVYMDEETVQQFTESLDSSFEGIGAEVSMQGGKVTIVAPFKDSPAEKAGLKPNDKILTIDGKSIDGLDLYEAVLKIRGEKGTTVTLGIQRAGVSEPLDVKVKRDEIPIETVYADQFNINGKTIGLLEITSFSEETAKDFQEELNALEEKGIDGLVIDVRGNPGGYLESVEHISKILLPGNKPYVQIEDRNGNKQRLISSLKEKKPYPIVGLIDEGSASASEILAAALKEAGGYKLVGVNSFGKGTVQQTVDLGDGSNLKLTMFKWLTPDGNWIHEKGIKPTVKVEQPDYFYANPLTVDKEPLAYDMNNDQVKNAQKMLDGLGFAPGRTDGYFSEETKQAVIAFQKKNKLEATGKIDAETATKLQDNVLAEIRDRSNDLQLKTALELAAE